MKKKKICRYAVYTMCAIGLFLIFGAANSVAFSMDMQIIEPWYAHLGQALIGVLMTLPYLVGRIYVSWLR